jgi:hypothetical protein
MHLGQTVFYRLTADDAETISAIRKDALNAALSRFSHGDKVKEGQVLPAEVVTLEYKNPRSADVVAGIRVLLPGNDVLWLPEKLEAYEIDEDRATGFLPVPGFFVQAPPLEAEL